MRSTKKVFPRPEWWDDTDAWMTAADILAAVGPLALIVVALAMVVSAL